MSNHEFKIYFFKDNLRISPILDKSIVNMVVEIPKNTRKKLEIQRV